MVTFSCFPQHIGAGLALLGAIKNQRPQYGHYSGYPSSYASPGYSPYGHSGYPQQAQLAYPARPAYPAHQSYPAPGYSPYGHSAYPVPAQPAYPSHYPSPYTGGGYGSGYPLAKSENIDLPELNKDEKVSDNSTSQEVEQPSYQPDEMVADIDDIENENDGETLKVDIFDDQLKPTEVAIPSDDETDDNGLVLYPTLILPSQPPKYVLPNSDIFSNNYYEPMASFSADPYHTQFIPIGLNNYYPYVFANYVPQGRQKRSSNDEQVTQQDRMESAGNSEDKFVTKNAINTADISTNDDAEKEMIMPKDTQAGDQSNTLKKEETMYALEEYKPPITIEERKKKKKKPSKGTLLAAGLLGAAAGYALTNHGVNSYYNNRPPQYPGVGGYGGNAGGHGGYGGGHFGGYVPYGGYGYPPSRPAYANHYPRPPVYYPFYRSITLNNEKLDSSIEGKEVNETRSPFILLSTQPDQAQRPNQFPYNQQFYYQQYYANQYEQLQQLQQPQVNQNRFVYLVYGQPFIQNQVVTPQQDITPS